MPEGDTVYQTGQRLAILVGKRLVRGELRHPRLSTVDLTGREVIGIRTYGKHIFVRFNRDLTLHNHLMMDGSWRILGPGARPNHQTRVILGTAESTALGINLKQLALVPTPEEDRLIAHLGPDLLDPTWSQTHAAQAIERLSREPDREIGQALLDQTTVAGIGNVYKSEICFLLGVSPYTAVSEVDLQEAVRLGHDLLLRNATTPNRTTTDNPRRRLWVYGSRTPCLRCGTRIQLTNQGEGLRERVTYHCPRCQPG
jgi:endonuclease VIII